MPKNSQTEQQSIGILYIVATPIGNLEDITLRALRILSEVSIIFCEDTRTTGKLLSHHGIKTKTASYHGHASEKTHQHILKLLEEGNNIALVSDAGTPGISDPGAKIVSEIHNAFGADANVQTIPGPTAVTAALSISGLFGNAYTFYGFLPHKKGRETLLKRIVAEEMISVFYESTHRLLKMLVSFEKIAPTRTIVIAKELTKIHEGVFRGTPSELVTFFTEHPEKQKGEFVVLVGPENI